MRFSGTSSTTLLAALVVVACSDGGTSRLPPGKSGTEEVSIGGTMSIGGSATSTGGVALRGSISTGGFISNGGSGANVGNPPTGGNFAVGGVLSTGGVPLGAGGNVISMGGAPASGGIANSSGGMVSASGGVLVATGGAMTASGGAKGSTGGAIAAGGAVANCGDAQPPNGDTCAHAVQYGWCGAAWMLGACAQSCGLCSGTGAGGTPGAGGNPATGGNRPAGGAPGTGGVQATGGSNATGGMSNMGGTSASSTATNTPITGANGFATRYWDCCKPSCSWTTSVPSCSQDGSTRITDKNASSGCAGGNAFECYDFSPWYDASTNMSYGFAAFNGVACGTCYELQFTGTGQYGNNAGAVAVKGKQMIVQVINIGGLASNQFDLLIPGGGVGAMTGGCSAQWGSGTDFGVTYGGLLSECNGDASCMSGKCQSVFGKYPSLLAGCNWFTGWFSSADDPQMVYKQVTCPSQITSKSGMSA